MTKEQIMRQRALEQAGLVPCPVHGQPKKAVLYNEEIIVDWLYEVSYLDPEDAHKVARALVTKLNERALALDIESEVEIAPWVDRGPLGEVR